MDSGSVVCSQQLKAKQVLSIPGVVWTQSFMTASYEKAYFVPAFVKENLCKQLDTLQYHGHRPQGGANLLSAVRISRGLSYIGLWLNYPLIDRFSAPQHQCTR